MSESVTKDVVISFYCELIEILPLEDKKFFAKLYQKNLLPLGSGGVIEELKTRQDKVTYFLNSIVIPSPETFLPKLLEVMDTKECDNLAVNSLAKKIETMLADCQNNDRSKKQKRQERDKKDTREFTYDSDSSVDDFNSTSHQLIEPKIYQDYQLMKKDTAHLKKLKTQAVIELHKKIEEVNLLKVKILKLDIALLESKSYHLKDKNHHLKNQLLKQQEAISKLLKHPKSKQLLKCPKSKQLLKRPNSQQLLKRYRSKLKRP